MKSLKFILGAASSLLLSCTGGGDAPAPTQVHTRICAGTTKAAAGPQDSGLYPVLWQEGDRISVNGNLSNPLGASFAGSGEAVFAFSGFSSAAPFNMLYPGSTDGTVVLDGATPAMYAVNQSLDEVAQFHQLTAGIYVELYGELSLSSLTLESLGGEAPGGTFSVAFPSGALSAASSVGSLERTFASPASLSMDAPLAVCWFIKPGTYASGLTLRAGSPQGTVLSWSFGRGKTLETGKMYKLDPVSFLSPVPNLPDDTDDPDDPSDPADDGIQVTLEEMTELVYGYGL